MPYYLRILPDQTEQVWLIDQSAALRGGTTPSPDAVGSYYLADDGETIWQTMARKTGWFEPDGPCPFIRLTLPAGHHYPRIARPTATAGSARIHSPSFRSDRNALAAAKGQMAALTTQLAQICRTIYPDERTFSTWGHDIRNLLILAATEVEMNLRGVLKANGSTKIKPNMNDYVALAEILRLEDYSISFNNYPWLAPIQPFAGWSKDQPTESLAWYAAYNGVKHDREGAFELGSLGRAFEAVTACAILLIAQYGRQNGLGFPPELSAFFHVETEPEWGPQDAYSGPFADTGGDWVAVNHPLLEAIREPVKRNPVVGKTSLRPRAQTAGS